MTDWFSKLTKATLTTKKTAITVATILINDWIANFGILSRVLIDNGSQLTPKSFQAIHKELRLKLLIVTEYYQQRNGQVNRLKGTIVSRHRHYIAEHQQGWDS